MSSKVTDVSMLGYHLSTEGSRVWGVRYSAAALQIICKSKTISKSEFYKYILSRA